MREKVRKKKVLHETSSLQLHVVELSSAPINGRRLVKFVLHTIHQSEEEHQSNGITWLEEYVQENMSTVNQMSLVAEFLDNKQDMPHGHAFEGTENGKPVFSSAVTGSFGDPKIETININGVAERVLTAVSTIDEQRFPNFVAWLQNELSEGRSVKGSVEICSRVPGETITYLDGWKPIGRIPTKYVYSGFCVLGGVDPADGNCVLLELNNANPPTLDTIKSQIASLGTQVRSNNLNDFNSIMAQISGLELNKSTEKSVSSKSKNNNKEEINMDKKEFETLLADMKTQLIAELNQVGGGDDDVREVCAERDSLKLKVAELEAKIEKMTSEKNEADAEVTKLRNDTLVAELNSHLAQFTEEERNTAKAEIDAFRKNPVKSEINSIIGAVMIAKAKRQMEHAKTITEQNSFDDGSKHSLSDIYGAMDDNHYSPTGEGGLF